jgi:hypothetical protein
MTVNPPLVGLQDDQKTFIVPASVIDMQTHIFDDPESIEILLFQTGFSLVRLPLRGFWNLTSMHSICIPASVEVIESDCFVVSDSSTESSPLKNVTSEARSKLRQIAPFAFRGCFLTNFDGLQLLHNFGRDSTVKIPDEVQTLTERCFCQCNELQIVEFSRDSQIHSIEDFVFEKCQQLQSFCVPASVTEIGKSAFDSCTALCSVTFERGSELVLIHFRAFGYCSSLTSISIPSSVKVINGSCLADCRALEAVEILADSHLVRLRSAVFTGCSVLSSLTIPVSVEYIGQRCFAQCFALRTLTFSAPSRLRALLDVPPRWRGVVTIPDSVERLCVSNLPRASECVLDFGAESRLKRIDPLDPSVSDCFLRISSLGLKRIRAQLEFAPGQANEAPLFTMDDLEERIL